MIWKAQTVLVVVSGNSLRGNKSIPSTLSLAPNRSVLPLHATTNSKAVDIRCSVMGNTELCCPKVGGKMPGNTSSHQAQSRALQLAIEHTVAVLVLVAVLC
ncbi:hypothetical protein J6590_030546 [Homalodisca vitripennis]|nr:hypothetical protein J6590_030546 [Homalodisca vitripennis]